MKEDNSQLLICKDCGNKLNSAPYGDSPFFTVEPCRNCAHLRSIANDPEAMERELNPVAEETEEDPLENTLECLFAKMRVEMPGGWSIAVGTSGYLEECDVMLMDTEGEEVEFTYEKGCSIKERIFAALNTAKELARGE